MDVSIIIVNYNTRQLAIECLESIFKYTKNLDFEVIVVDNNSNDGSGKAIKEVYPNIKLILSDENLGFGRANNLAYESSIGEYLFFLNSDTLLVENSIKLLHDYIKNDFYIGALGAVLIDADNNIIHSYAENFMSCITELRIIFSKIRRRKTIVKKNRKYQINSSVPPFTVAYVTGADLMVPRKVFKKLQGFDSNFFMYYEENELQYRMMQIGFKRMILPSTKIIHLEGKSSLEISQFKRLMVAESMLYYFRKKLSVVSFFCFKMFLFIGHSLEPKRNFTKNENKVYMNLFNPFKYRK